MGTAETLLYLMMYMNFCLYFLQFSSSLDTIQ